MTKSNIKDYECGQDYEGYNVKISFEKIFNSTDLVTNE